MRKFIVYILAVFVLSSCNRDYQKLLKSTDYSKRYEAGIAYFKEEDYFKAKELLEPLFSVYKGTGKGETVLYYLAHSYLKLEDYLWAGYYFKIYSTTFPIGSYIEDCEYYVAYCFYMESPEYNLDQEYTIEALDAFQVFLSKYPNSDKIPSCTKYVDEINAKLEKKAFENAKLYYTIMDYKAAVIALKNVLKKFPTTSYKEEALFLIVKSSYLVATNSIEAKKEERFENTIEEYFEYIDEFPNGEHSEKAEKIYNNCKKVIN